jgi:uncharacterized protein YbaR (Trm112 family)
MNIAISPPVQTRPRGVAQTRLLELLCCGRCGGPLEPAEAALACRACIQSYPVTDGVPQLFVPNEWASGKLDVTDIVEEFYEQTPFPNHDDLDSRESLQSKARLGVFARLLDEQIPPGALVLEAGCGTGQLTNFLGMNWRRRVIGTDLCMNSLRLGKGFCDSFAIVNADFLQMNPFRPPFSDASRLGRLPTLWQRRLLDVFGDRMAALDSRLRGDALNTGRWAAWFRDQYKHPHESKHAMGEVVRWFKASHVEFVSSIPSIGDVDFADDEQLFEQHSNWNAPRPFLERAGNAHLGRQGRRAFHHD